MNKCLLVWDDSQISGEPAATLRCDRCERIMRFSFGDMFEIEFQTDGAPTAVLCVACATELQAQYASTLINKLIY